MAWKGRFHFSIAFNLELRIELKFGIAWEGMNVVYSVV